MKNIRQVISGILVLITLYMGFKQGWPMVTGEAGMLNMLGQWGIEGSMVVLMGVAVMLSAVLLLLPQTFEWGNIITAIVILLVLIGQVSKQDYESALIEIPFFIMPFVLIYLGYPLAKNHPDQISDIR